MKHYKTTNFTYNLFHFLNRKLNYLLILLLFSETLLFGQSNLQYGSLSGKILDDTNSPLIGANIVILNSSIGTTTNLEGYFIIPKLSVGNHTIKISYIGFETQTFNISIYANKTTSLNVILKPKIFNIGGIVVSAEDELMPDAVETKTQIKSGEIEHYQATNLGDVLDLVPGIQKTTNPGIDKTSQISVRGTRTTSMDYVDPQSAFGTKLIIDGQPISNNSNLQFEALDGAKFGSFNIQGGIDLRLIPADNLESVTVISGMPSVRYGDFTTGVIELQTKMGAEPQRMKIKINPKTKEANFNGGFLTSENNTNSISYNFNIARSERDLRLVGDEFSRYTAQTVYSTIYKDVWKSNYKLYGQTVYDEEEPQGDFQKTKNYNRSYSIGFNTWGAIQPEIISKLDYNAFLNIKKIDSHESKIVTDYLITPQNDTLASYIGVVENKGLEITSGGRIEWENIFYTSDFIHKSLIGSEIQYEDNTGEGLIIDSVYNYYGVTSGKRSYSFDEIPSQTLLSFYAEDKITGKLWWDISLLIGARFDFYRPYKLDLGGLFDGNDLIKSHQGSFFNPRLSLLIYFSKDNQLRINLGKSSKTAPMSYLFPPEEVMEWRNPVSGEITHFRFDKRNPDLKGYQTTQAEISYDHKLFDFLGTSISAYYREKNNSPISFSSPFFTEIDNNGDKEIYYINNLVQYSNSGRNYNHGIEFTLKTKRIDELNMSFKVTGSYNFTYQPSIGKNFSLTPDTSIGQYPNYLPPEVSSDTLIGWTYPHSGYWSDGFQMNYYIHYTNKKLGLWVTLRAEQLVLDRNQEFQLPPVDLEKLTDEARNDRLWEESVFLRPPKWLFNFNISKSLFDGAEISLYVNNFVDNPALWKRYDEIREYYTEYTRNPELFYGIEFSMIFDKIVGK